MFYLKSFSAAPASPPSAPPSFKVCGIYIDNMVLNEGGGVLLEFLMLLVVYLALAVCLLDCKPYSLIM